MATLAELLGADSKAPVSVPSRIEFTGWKPPTLSKSEAHLTFNADEWKGDSMVRVVLPREAVKKYASKTLKVTVEFI